MYKGCSRRVLDRTLQREADRLTPEGQAQLMELAADVNRMSDGGGRSAVTVAQAEAGRCTFVRVVVLALPEERYNVAVLRGELSCTLRGDGGGFNDVVDWIAEQGKQLITW